MSHHVYIVDKEAELLIDCGNITTEMFHGDYDLYRNVKNSIYDDNSEYISHERFSKLTVRQTKTLLDCYAMFLDLSCIATRWIALDYWYANSDKKLVLISECSIGDEYAEYKVVR